MTTAFQILHLSDFHFSDDANRLPSPLQDGNWSSAFSALKKGSDCNWLKPASHSSRAARAVSRYISRTLKLIYDFDLIVISGDLATTGRVEDLRVAKSFIGPHSGREWVDRRQEPVFVSDGVPMFVVPGNHDRYENHLFSPGSQRFDEEFSDLWRSSSECRRVTDAMVFDKDGTTLCVIGADFTFKSRSECTNILRVAGRGLVHADVLQNLVLETERVRGLHHDALIIWVTHYPVGFCGIDPGLSLIDEQNLVSAAAKCDVKLLMSGHTHEQRAYTLGGCTVSCAGSATQANSADMWQFSICELTVDRSTVKQVAITPFQYQSLNRNNFVKLEPTITYSDAMS